MLQKGLYIGHLRALVFYQNGEIPGLGAQCLSTSIVSFDITNNYNLL